MSKTPLKMDQTSFILLFGCLRYMKVGEEYVKDELKTYLNSHGQSNLSFEDVLKKGQVSCQLKIPIRTGYYKSSPLGFLTLEIEESVDGKKLAFEHEQLTYYI
jgi:hypothetical protein